ncbi:hypothetical protein [Streptomyces achromogenes]|uniref:hypothetical protein n=1 Tax=Streptomyces achromogenes TaxID=67255 RepID=UPI0036B2468D
MSHDPQPPTPVRTADRLTVRGGRPLHGSVSTSGFKHSLVTTVAAACLGQGTARIGNCPPIAETGTLAALVERLGGSARLTGTTLTLDPSAITTSTLDPRLSAAIHGSVYLAPMLLARFGSVTMPGTGGCRIGDGTGGRRPVSHYVDVLGRFGARGHTLADGGFTVRASRLHACALDLADYWTHYGSGPYHSGATKVAVLAAAVADGTTVLDHVYGKPDVLDMVALLRQAGVAIEEPAHGRLVIHGVPDLPTAPSAITLPADLIEVVTWCCASLLSPEGITITGAGMDRALRALAPELHVLRSLGIPLHTGTGTLTVGPAALPLAPVDVVVCADGVFSDSQPFLTLLAGFAEGVSKIQDTVWTSRFGYVDQLAELGVKLDARDGSVRVHGPWPAAVPGRRLTAGDLRAAAMLLLAALHVPGVTHLAGMSHLARGYADLPGRLRLLGADITEA